VRHLSSPRTASSTSITIGRSGRSTRLLTPGLSDLTIAREARPPASWTAPRVDGSSRHGRAWMKPAASGRGLAGHAGHAARVERQGRALIASNAQRYHGMIKSFRDKDSQKLLDRHRVRRWPLGLQQAALKKLLMLDAAVTLDDLRVPSGNRLEKLSGDREGQRSIRGSTGSGASASCGATATPMRSRSWTTTEGAGRSDGPEKSLVGRS